MKIIDILNKINKNEEVPEKIKFEDTIFEYSKENDDYVHKIDEDGWINETLLFKVMNTHFISDLLRTEVEVIEDNKEIIERLPIYPNYAYKIQDISEDRLKINELVQAVNKINKEREEK